MDDKVISFPTGFEDIEIETKNINFDQVSDALLGSLLSTLAATKPNGNFLELGTGSGLSTSWILRGMDKKSRLETIDNDEQLAGIAKKHLEHDNRVKFHIGKGEKLILNIDKNSMDFIFADTWPGKYNHLEETLSLLKQGGIYLIDDMLPQENWPEGHSEKVNLLIQYLENREDIILTKQCWSTGIIICTKKA